MSLRSDAIKVAGFDYENSNEAQRLATHVLRETDPSPVTEEHLRERGFVFNGYWWEIGDLSYHAASGNLCIEQGQEAIHVPLTSIGQLDTLLRGLGCTG